MKKQRIIVLALAVCLLLTGCGKSKAVKNVETQIDALGTITEQSGGALSEARRSYADLEKKEQSHVSNYQALQDGEMAYARLTLVGSWYMKALNFENDAEEKATMVLNADGTGSMDGQDFSWVYQDGKIAAGDSNYIVSQQEGCVTLALEGDNSGCVMLCQDDFENYRQRNLLSVDLEKTDVNDVFYIYMQEYELYNDWGELDGNKALCVMLGSKLYDEGWYYAGGNVVIEVNVPEFYWTTSWENGDKCTEYVHADTVTCEGLGSPILLFSTFLTWDDGTIQSSYYDFTEDQFSFGRATGKMYFVNKDIVTDVRWKDRYHRILKTTDPISTEIQVYSDRDFGGDEHPF